MVPGSVSRTITLPNNTTPVTLYSQLIKSTGLSQLGPNCNRLVIRGDDSLGSGIVYEGDVTVSSSNYGIALSAGDSRTWPAESQLNNISLIDKWLVGSTGGLKVNVELYVA